MSKMKMPEMSIVRFEESDVICASTYIPKSMSISNWNNGGITDGVIKYGGNTFTYSPHDNQNDVTDTFIFNSDYSGYYIETAGGYRTTFGFLTSHEGQDPYDGQNGPADGSYIWNENTSTFNFIHQ